MIFINHMNHHHHHRRRRHHCHIIMVIAIIIIKSSSIINVSIIGIALLTYFFSMALRAITSAVGQNKRWVKPACFCWFTSASCDSTRP
jgi:hypothetical protein